ncbi:ABC transporter ATP-binding protein [Aestuariirhabdus litorea]|uniref:ABC transporter ATP-binding protein n=1 Tax=Aestuariirhabdus litorea TaxID=2528527 RepID=A0A3P3VSF0_9GAMM|nr:ABC transporter ATP-binding protein [Aestuariirhabdus litorea]RRJ84898.1 ABC transporter ATP-binding protein [Aestuariirhabdus litorea]RWW98124.1 dipeptide ABC transporter ATP-binding protein [Endozoicomonadaceae bacterium GTF-13]
MSTPLLQVEKLAVTFRSGEESVTAVEEISFSLERGETLALVGESGSGKSVTAHSILQLLPYPTAQHPRGSILLEGKELVGADEPTLRAIRGDRISIIFQEPMTSLNPLHNISRQIGEVISLHRGGDKTSIRNRTLELLELVGIREPEKRLQAYPHELSGGQRQRVMIAMALANEPDLLIADEPTTALDVTVQKQILDLLQELQAKLGMAILLITHDLPIVRRVADRVCVMHRGRCIEQADTETIFQAPKEDYTRQLIGSIPSGQPQPLGADPSPLLSAHDLRVWFPIRKGVLRRTRDYVKAVDGISFELAAGETLGIVGESGSGKSTLGFAILKLIESRGEILFDQQPIHPLNQKAFRPLRKAIQIVFQDPFGSLNPRMSIGQVISEGLSIHGISADEQKQRVDESLREVGLDPNAAHRYPHEFSGGQRQRVAIARALVLRPRLIILDEPTSALDRTVQIQVLELLKNLQQKYGIAYIFISHDLAVVKSISHRVLVMQNGKMVEQGSAEALFNAPTEPYTRELLAAALV